VKVNIHAAKTTLSKLIERAHAGEEVIIARGDQPVARLVPIVEDAPERKPGTLRGLVRVPESFFEPLPSDEIDAWDRDPS
jgi:antitoxin (DNA-binding transcriptional repressor) of toxin-antitoxin stability system